MTQLASQWEELADSSAVQQALAALQANNIAAHLAESGADAHRLVLELIPPGSEVLTSTSRTLDAIGITREVNESGRYNAVRPRYLALNHATQADEIRKLRSIPDIIVGSVHALTTDGHLVIASAGGSQLAPYVFGARQVIWVVGTHKIVPNLEAALLRIEEHSLPLENERAMQAYGRGSAINKILIVNREALPGRATVILVPEVLGF